MNDAFLNRLFASRNNKELILDFKGLDPSKLVAHTQPAIMSIAKICLKEFLVLSEFSHYSGSSSMYSYIARQSLAAEKVNSLILYGRSAGELSTEGVRTA